MRIERLILVVVGEELFEEMIFDQRPEEVRQ